jgi:hypothetical protein
MNLDYWEEHIRATVATAAHLAVPVNMEYTVVYFPIILKDH